MGRTSVEAGPVADPSEVEYTPAECAGCTEFRAANDLLSAQSAAQSQRAMVAEAAAGKLLRELDVAKEKLAAWKSRAESAEKRVVTGEILIAEQRRGNEMLERIATACEFGSGWRSRQ